MNLSLLFATLLLVGFPCFVAGVLIHKHYRDMCESDAEHVVERLTARLARGTVIPLSKVRMRGRHRKGGAS